jgi:hypothetical protein
MLIVHVLFIWIPPGVHIRSVSSYVLKGFPPIPNVSRETFEKPKGVS